jgi:hypothetical protein
MDNQPKACVKGLIPDSCSRKIQAGGSRELSRFQ